MKKIIIYTKTTCPYCVKAKSLLDQKKAEYNEINIDNNDSKREEMLAKSNGMRTVPQIFIGDYHVGGCDDLYDLESSSKLDQLLNE